MRKIKSILSITKMACLKHRAEWYRFCARDHAMSLINENVPFLPQNSRDILAAVTKDHILLEKKIQERQTKLCLDSPWNPDLPYSLSPLVEMVTCGVLGGLKFSHYIQNLDMNSGIKTVMISFLFSSLKVAARLEARLPSFPPGGKSCDWVINTLMDPAGTVSCNLIGKEIIWVIDSDKQLLSDWSALSLTPPKTFKSFIPWKNRDARRASEVKLCPSNQYSIACPGLRF